MGFRAGHTEAAAIAKGWKLEEKRSMHARDSLLGQSIHCGTLAVLVTSSLAQWGLLRKLPSLEELDLANLRKDRDEGRPSSARRLARMYASYATHRGNEIRLEAGPRRMLQKPSWQQVDARQWTWQTVISCVWQIEGESMPSLEARAVLLTLQWRARSVSHHGILRAMEALDAHVGDFTLKVPLGSGYLSLPDNNTSTRHGRKRQTKTLEDPELVAWASKWCEGKTPGERICPVSAAAMKEICGGSAGARLVQHGPAVIQHAPRQGHRTFLPRQRHGSDHHERSLGKLYHPQTVC